ncbi:MAG: lasso RiPP family leader peptide-containing protein [Solirubrobacterales bacterium]|nr:lasso RiPP family leader peptide-containing protein [Solirubrobacterales bacterium]
MDETRVLAYQTPQVVDYGDLQELTAACLGGTGGDAFDPSGVAGGYSVGASNPAAGCKSTP